MITGCCFVVVHIHGDELLDVIMVVVISVIYFLLLLVERECGTREDASTEDGFILDASLIVISYLGIDAVLRCNLHVEGDGHNHQVY